MQRLAKTKKLADAHSPDSSPDEIIDEGDGGSEVAADVAGGAVAAAAASAAVEEEDPYRQATPKTPDQNNEVTLYQLEPAGQQQASFRNESRWGLLARLLILIFGLWSVASAVVILTLLALAYRLNIYFSIECSLLIFQSIIGIYVVLTRSKVLISTFAVFCILNACAVVGLLLFTVTTNVEKSSTADSPRRTGLAQESVNIIPVDYMPHALSAIDHNTTIVSHIRASSISPFNVPVAKSPNTTTPVPLVAAETPHDPNTDEADVRAHSLERLNSSYKIAFRAGMHEDPDERLKIVAYLLWIAIVCNLLSAVTAVLLFHFVSTNDYSNDSGGFSQIHTRRNRTINTRRTRKSPLLLLVRKAVDRANQDPHVEILRPTIRTGRLDQALQYGAQPLASNIVRSPNRKSMSPASPTRGVRPSKNPRRKSKYAEKSPKRQLLVNKEVKRKYLEPKRIESPKASSYRFQPVHKLVDESSSIIAKLKDTRGTQTTLNVPSTKSLYSDNPLRAQTRTGSLREDPTSAGF